MEQTTNSRVALAYALGGLAIALRMLSDWIFPRGGPLAYQLLQGGLLLGALLLLAPGLDRVFVKGGETRRALKIALWCAPAGLLIGLVDALISYGRPAWPSPDQLLVPIANNLFFPAVEELEFRGFALSWFLRKKVPVPASIAAITILSALAHAHRFWSIDPRAWFFLLALNLFWTLIVARTRSLWGGYAAHAAWNIFVLLPELGLGTNLR